MVQLMAPFILSREVLSSPIGGVLLLTDAEGRLRALDFDDYVERMTRLLNRHYGAGGWRIEEASTRTAAHAALARYFAGDVRAVDTLETATGGTPFQRSVWAALRQVPAGAPESYAALARRVGRERAVRAVGLANSQNPVAIVAPCHRIVGANGALTGYAGGLERKRWLLQHEAEHRRAP